jgi:hypothetical protein
MFCTQCGAKNADNTTICMQCGRNLYAEPPTISLHPIAQPPVDVPNYLVFAILATVLCCLPTGVAAIIYAAQVNGKLQAGDIPGAQAASRNAKSWCWISFWLGLAFTLVIVVGTIRRIGGAH